MGPGRLRRGSASPPATRGQGHGRGQDAALFPASRLRVEPHFCQRETPHDISLGRRKGWLSGQALGHGPRHFCVPDSPVTPLRAEPQRSIESPVLKVSPSRCEQSAQRQGRTE